MVRCACISVAFKNVLRPLSPAFSAPVAAAVVQEKCVIGSVWGFSAPVAAVFPHLYLLVCVVHQISFKASSSDAVSLSLSEVSDDPLEDAEHVVVQSSGRRANLLQSLQMVTLELPSNSRLQSSAFVIGVIFTIFG